MKEKYFIVNKKVLPLVFEKVVEAKKLLYSKKCKTVNEATQLVGISRSAFYKYKDDVSVYVEDNGRNIITMSILLNDQIGLLSALLTLLSSYGVNILTINQNIPVDDIAPVTISMTVQDMTCSEEELKENIKNMKGVLRVDLLAKS